MNRDLTRHFHQLPGGERDDDVIAHRAAPVAPLHPHRADDERLKRFGQRIAQDRHLIGVKRAQRRIEIQIRRLAQRMHDKGIAALLPGRAGGFDHDTVVQRRLLGPPDRPRDMGRKGRAVAGREMPQHHLHRLGIKVAFGLGHVQRRLDAQGRAAPQRRRDAHAFVDQPPGQQDRKPALLVQRDQRCPACARAQGLGHPDLKPAQQAAPAILKLQLGKGRDQPGMDGLQLRAPRRHIGQHGAIVRQQTIQKRMRRQRRIFVAREGRGMLQGQIAAGHAFVDQRRADAHDAAAKRLAKRHRIGDDPGPFRREQGSAAPETGLHLVKDQKRAVPVANSAQMRKERGIADIDAALALDGFDDDRGNAVAKALHDVFDRLGIAEGNEDRPVILPGPDIAAAHVGDGHGPACLAVKAARHGQNGVPAGRHARGLQRDLDRLGTAVRKHRALEFAGRDFQQTPGQIHRRIGEMGLDQARSAIRQPGRDRRMDIRRIMTKGQCAVTRHKVQNPVPVIKEKGAALGADIASCQGRRMQQRTEFGIDRACVEKRAGTFVHGGIPGLRTGSAISLKAAWGRNPPPAARSRTECPRWRSAFAARAPARSSRAASGYGGHRASPLRPTFPAF